MRPVSILIIAAADPMRQMLELSLQKCGCDVLIADTVDLGVQRAMVHLPDVVLVSPTLPATDSTDICQRIRDHVERPHDPVIVLIPRTGNAPANVTDANTTRLIDVARFAEAVSTLGNSANHSSVTCENLVTQGLSLDRKAFRASIDGRELRLTVTEFNLLWMLARHVGAVLSRRDLCDECRDDEKDRPCRSVDVHVRSLRLKLGDRADIVETVRGVGYRMREVQSGDTQCDDLVSTGGCC